MLRAQIARITHAAELCPKDYFTVDEETNEVKLAEELPPMDTETLKSLENWVHKHPIIYTSGRCDQIPNPALNEEDAAKEAEEFEAAKVDRFRIVQED